jgi:hypothetical protein
VIPRKVPADFSLANHDAPEALPPKCPKKKRWVLVDTARAVPYRFRVRKGRQGIEKAQIGEMAQAWPSRENPKSAGAEFQNVTD